MEAFNNLMEDIKDALVLSTRKKGLFLPALLINAVLLVLILVLVISVAAIVFTTATGLALQDAFYDPSLLSGALILPILIILLMGLLLAISFLIFDIGITGMVIGTVDGQSPSRKLFFETVKKELLPVLLTKIGFAILIMISAIIWLLPWLLYALIVGSLTVGWGMIFLSCALQSLVGFWVLIKIEDQRGGFESIGRNIQFGRQHFWLLVLIFFLQIRLASFLPSLFGVIGAAFATLFISYLVTTFFKIVLLKTYRRYRSTEI